MDEKVSLNKETVDILVANIIPTTKYFETRFDYLQHQIDEIKRFQIDFKKDVDRRFEEVNKKFELVDKRFEQVDKRFEQVDKRFEQVDKRFEKIEQKISSLTEEIHNLALEVKELGKKQEVTLREYIIERDRYYDKKFQNLRMFNIAIISLVAGILIKLFM
jgi:chromosome segregation ATPase